MEIASKNNEFIGKHIEKDGDDDHSFVTFYPPLNLQRHLKVVEILHHLKPNKVADFGCAQLNLINLLKQEAYIEQLLAVDIDEKLLNSAKCKLFPKSFDFVHPRKNPLNIKVFCGSVSDIDERFKDIDVVICVELVEHLWPETLKQLPNNIFGFIKPKHVIISTPNSDYNVIFKNDPPRYRHWDHKFEWSRKEFEDWSSDICERFGYEVRFDGVGEPTEDHPGVGFCSQFAIFKQTQSSIIDSSQCIQSYNLVTEIVYPHESLQALIKQFLDSVSNHLYCKEFLSSSRKRVPVESRIKIKSRTFGRSLFTSFQKECFYKNRVSSFNSQFKDAVEERSTNNPSPSSNSSDTSSFPPHMSTVWQRLSEIREKYLKIRSQVKHQNQFDDVCDEDNEDELSISQNIFPSFPSPPSFEVYVDDSLKIPICVTTLQLLSPALSSHQIVLTDTNYIFIPLSFLHKLADIIKVQLVLDDFSKMFPDDLVDVLPSRGVLLRLYNSVESSSERSDSVCSDFSTDKSCEEIWN